MLSSATTRCQPASLGTHRFPLLWLTVAVRALVPRGVQASDGQAASLQVDKGDSIVFIGNTFAERMHLFGYFETFLHSKFPDHQLKIRNMGWSTDEVLLRPRPARFGDPRKYLEQENADLVFVCFGMNESFQGPRGLEEFQQGLDTYIKSVAVEFFDQMRISLTRCLTAVSRKLA